jgi:hypothetical protein
MTDSAFATDLGHELMATRAVRFVAMWRERLHASIDFAQGDVLELTETGTLTVTDRSPWDAIFPDEEDELCVWLDDGCARSELGGPVLRWPSRGDEGEGGRKAKRVINLNSPLPGPPGGADGRRTVRFSAVWTERLPADTEFEVGDRIVFDDIGELTVTDVALMGKVWRRQTEDLLLVRLDDGSEKHTFEERTSELTRQYWAKIRGRD